MAKGKVNEVEFANKGDIIKRKGGGTQYQILQEPSKGGFPEGSIKRVDDYIKRSTSTK